MIRWQGGLIDGAFGSGFDFDCHGGPVAVLNASEGWEVFQILPKTWEESAIFEAWLPMDIGVRRGRLVDADYIRRGDPEVPMAEIVKRAASAVECKLDNFGDDRSYCARAAWYCNAREWERSKS